MSEISALRANDVSKYAPSCSLLHQSLSIKQHN